MRVLLLFLTIGMNMKRSEITSVAVFMFCCVGNRKSKVNVHTEIAQSLFLNNSTVK